MKFMIRVLLITVIILGSNTISLHAEKSEQYYAPPSEFCKAVLLGDLEKVRSMLKKNPYHANDGYGYGETALQDAARLGHVEIAKLLFENNVRIQRSMTRSPLLLAARGGHLEMVKLLILNGQSILKNYGTGPLHEAVANNHVKVARYLIEKGVELNLRHNGKDSTSILHIATFYGYDSMVRLLISSGIDINGVYGYNHKYTALHLAAITGNTQIAELLIKGGAKTDLKDYINNTLLHLSLEKLKSSNRYKKIISFYYRYSRGYGMPLRQIDIKQNGKRVGSVLKPKDMYKTLKYFLETGVKVVNKKNKAGYTALHLATISGNEKTVELLLKYKSKNKIRDKEGKTAWHLAAQNSHSGLIKIFLKNGVDINLKDGRGCTALHYAARNRNLELTKYLLKNGADQNIKDKQGHSPLYAKNLKWPLSEYIVKIDKSNSNKITDITKALSEAVSFRRIVVSLLLLKRGADLNNPKYGSPPLISALSNDSNDLMTMLIEFGADINYVDGSGNSTLHIAASRGFKEGIDKLTDMGMDINITNSKDGKTPLFKAIEYAPESVEFMIKKGASVKSQNKYGETPAFYALRYNKLEAFQVLINSGSDIDHITNYGETMLYSAVNSNNLKFIKLLLKNGANPYLPKGKSSFDRAKELKKNEILKLFKETDSSAD
ncbi:MAG: hypothetical protein GY760_10450 [Deltaproteobacteria bacterium]|nr:hypothetical protein [Deltaproteobacteria bacterium]